MPTKPDELLAIARARAGRSDRRRSRSPAEPRRRRRVRGQRHRDRRPNRAAARARIEQVVREGRSWRATACRRRGFECANRRTRRSRAIARGEFGYPLVLKADGLAAGKGVVIAEDRAAAEAAVRDVDGRPQVRRRRRARRARRVSVGRGSVVLRACRRHAAFMPLSSAQDHKRIFDDDRGTEHGRHGRVRAEPADHTGRRAARHRRDRRPVLDGMAREGHPYRGFLYVGLMLTGDGPKVDRVQRALRRSRGAGRCCRCSTRICPGCSVPRRPARCRRDAARFRDEPHVGVVLAAGGYPDASETGKSITGLEAAARGAERAGVSCRNGAAGRSDRDRGGRVLTVVGRGADVPGGNRYRVRGRVAHPVRRHAVSSRHRPEGAGDCERSRLDELQ